jgi:ABC-2 type transport system ATP-binding protein
VDLISIEVQDLQKSMQKTPALKGLTLSFAPGRLHGIIGPEGAGKTTLLRCLMGLLKPDSGSLKYFSNQEEVSLAEIRPFLAYMPQTQSLYAELSIHEHLEFFKTLYQLTDQEYQERRERLLAITRLNEFVDREAGKLSGGMYKKLGLICALLASPKVLLLDEPTNGVDPLSRRDFWELVGELKKENILILVTTSYMDEAAKCDEVHLIFSGQALAEGEPAQVLKAEKAKTFDDVFLKYDTSLEENHEQR